MVASQLFREENEHPQAVLRFSSFLKNQVSWAELRCAELSWAELSCREAGGAGNLSWRGWKSEPGELDYSFHLFSAKVLGKPSIKIVWFLPKSDILDGAHELIVLAVCRPRAGYA